MAETKYSVRIRQAYAQIDPLKRAVEKVGKEKGVDSAEYKSLLKQLQDAQANYDKLKRAEERAAKQEKATKTTKDLQPELDAALATGDQKKAKELADKIAAAGGTPLGPNGRPLKGYEPKVSAVKTKDKETAASDLANAEAALNEAKKSGDAKKIQDATNKFTKARNDAIKAGVTNPDGTALGSTGGIKPPAKKTSGTDGTGGTGGDGGKGGKSLTDAEQRDQALNVAAEQDFALPETLFNNVPSLNALLKRYVAEDWTPDKLRKAIRDDVWFRKNSSEIKNRYVQLYNYEDLVKSGQDATQTDYAKQIETLKRKLADKARQMGSGLASDPAALDKAARNMYITNVGIDDPMTVDFIAAAIRPIGSALGGIGTEGYSGQALKDYQAIQGIAKANGFKVSDILPGGANEQQVLQGLATGKIDPDRLAQDARKLAAQGQPQYVRDLLGQGYNLDQVYAPYKQTMANILEINPDQIDLNDPTLRMAISDKGDMNIYDFKKALKKDQRWQYTDQAREEVSNIALTVLRDFGFQG